MFAYCAEHVPQLEHDLDLAATTCARPARPPCRRSPSRSPTASPTSQAALDAGLDIDDFAPRLSFFFNAHNDLLEEVAKFRAARRLWARIMRERFGAQDPRSLMLRFHTQTAGSTLTAQQPENNVVRVDRSGAGRGAGRLRSRCTPTRWTRRWRCRPRRRRGIALRTQQSSPTRSGVADVVDPLGGSYAVEALTDDIEDGADVYIRKIDALGGMVAAIEQGYMQREIQDAAFRWQREIEDKTRIVVGVNEFVSDDPPPGNLFQLDAGVGEALAERLARLRRTRDANRTARLWTRWRRAPGAATT